MKDPKNRLCNYDKIISDPFYRNFSFEELINMNLPPAYVPKLKSEPTVKQVSFNNYIKVRFFILACEREVQCKRPASNIKG